MGRDKSKLRLGSRSLLQHVQEVADALALPVRIILKDKVARCGPVGGIYTGLITSEHDAELFLACDMPFVATRSLRTFVSFYRKSGGPAFASGRLVGFPCIIPTGASATVMECISAGGLSLQGLARKLGASYLRGGSVRSLTNLNTPADLQRARMLLSLQQRHSGKKA
jgi:molybdopterin-guanine dinucleotide biosynthesis protein A